MAYQYIIAVINKIKSIWSKLSDKILPILILREKILNTPIGAGQGKFAEKFQHTLEREKMKANEQIRSHQGEVLSGLNDIAKRSDADPAKQNLMQQLSFSYYCSKNIPINDIYSLFTASMYIIWNDTFQIIYISKDIIMYHGIFY